ncbi:MAG: DUF1647 domain-containing protein [Cyclobacteriaceae bacterium]
MAASKNVIITAATSSYFRSFLQLLYSFNRTGEYHNSHIIFYDLGLADSQVTYFKETLLKKHSGIIYRKFNFENFPVFVKPQHKTYAWKPTIIHEVLEEMKGNVLWLDSANLILKPLTQVWKEISRNGAYLPISGSGSLEEWTCDSVLKALNVSAEDKLKRNRCGGLCGFSFENGAARQLVNDWAKHALIKSHIKPNGANRSNHRDDQSLLTILAYKAEREKMLHLGSDEVNISSSKPINTISVRNILPESFPSELLLCSALYFKIRRRIDILINRLLK